MSDGSSPAIPPAPFSHFMLQEIYDQVDSIQACLERWLNPPGSFVPTQLGLPEELWSGIQKIQILACGTSFHAGRVGQLFLEQLAGIPTTVFAASEFGDLLPPLTARTLTLAITQSGETSDTLSAIALEKTRRQNQLPPFQPRLLGLTNQVGTSLEQQVTHTLHTSIGKEVAIAATKTFTAQLITLLILSLDLGWQRRFISPDLLQKLLNEIRKIPAQIHQILEQKTPFIQQFAQQFANTQHLLLMARGIDFPIALEGALKLKETCYLHAEAYRAGELMHGPLALIDQKFLVIAIVSSTQAAEKIKPNLQKVRDRGACILGILPHKNLGIERLLDYSLSIPETDSFLTPILNVIPLQLFAYYLAVARGIDVDRPRSLTKAIC